MSAEKRFWLNKIVRAENKSFYDTLDDHRLLIKKSSKKLHI